MNHKLLTQIDTAESEVTDYLVSQGFTKNSHGDRWDSGSIGVYFDDTEVVVAGFAGKPGWDPVVWRSSLSLAMPLPMILGCITHLASEPQGSRSGSSTWRKV